MLSKSESVLRTNEDIRKAFLRDLATILGKYSTELSIAGDDNIEVHIPTRYNDRNEIVYGPIFLNLGSFVNADTLLTDVERKGFIK